MLRSGYVRLSSPWFFSTVPALAYLVAYLDRLGEALVHGVPIDWIAISLTDALSRTALVVIVLTLVVITARVGHGWTRAIPVWTRRAAIKLVEQLGPLALYAFMLRSKRLVAIFVGVSLLLTAGTALRDLITHRPPPPIPGRSGAVLLATSDASDVGDVQVKASLLLGLATVALVLSLFAGAGGAVMQDTVLVTSDRREIVAASYGTTAVLAGLRTSSGPRWEVGNERRLVNLTADPPVTVVRQSAPVSINW